MERLVSILHSMIDTLQSLSKAVEGVFLYSFLEGNSNQPRKKTMGRELTGSQGRMVRFLNLECLVLTPRLLIVLG